MLANQPRFNRPERHWVPAFFLLLYLMMPKSSAAWTAVGPGGGTLVLDFAIAAGTPSTMYATATVTGPGIWKSTNINAAATWANLVNTNNYYGVGVKPNDAMTALAGIQPGPVERTTNGATFGATTGSASHGAWVFAFSTSSPSTVYAGGFTDGLPPSGVMQKSTNSGATWASIAVDGDANPPVRSLAVDPNDANVIYAGVQPDTPNDGLHKSVDGGANWTYLSGTGYNLVNALALDPGNTSTIYVGTQNLGDIKRSIDGGTTWSTVHNRFAAGGVTTFRGVGGIAVNPNDRAIIYAAGGGIGTSRVILSTDCGDTWTEVVDAAGLGGANSLSKVVIDAANNLVYVLEGSGGREIFRETLVNASTGTCPTATVDPDAPDLADESGGDDDSDAKTSSSSSGSGGSSFDWVLLIVFLAIGFYRARSTSITGKIRQI